MCGGGEGGDGAGGNGGRNLGERALNLSVEKGVRDKREIEDTRGRGSGRGGRRTLPLRGGQTQCCG